jgi:hypothetical protein
MIIDKESFRWKHFVFGLIGAIYLANSIYNIYSNYFEIDEEQIRLLALSKTTIKFDDLVEVKYFGGDYIFRDAESKIVISKDNMNQKYLPDFKKYFEMAKLKYDNKPNVNMI